MATRPTRPRNLPEDYDPERPHETPAQMQARLDAENAKKGRPMTPEEIAAMNRGPFGFIGDAAKAVGGAIGDAAGAVVNVGKAVVNVAVKNPITQAAAAVATGGLSLAVQAGVEAATGKGGPVTGFFETLATDPLELVKALPGVVLTEVGLIGTVADVVSYAGAGTQAAFGENSTVGRIGGAAYNAVEDVQQAAKDDPVASLQVMAGVALAAIGVPVGNQLIKAGVANIVGDAARPDSPSGPGPELAPGPSSDGALQLPAFPGPAGGFPPPLTSGAAASDGEARGVPWKLVAGGAAALGAAAILTWLVQADPSP